MRPEGLPQRWQLKDDGSHNKGRWTKIIITVHHIDSDKKNSHPLNLLALCQRCHLRLDLQKHIAKRKQRESIPGQKMLIAAVLLKERG
jgi:hypothetical protein